MATRLNPQMGPNETNTPPTSAVMKPPAPTPPGPNQMGLVGGQAGMIKQAEPTTKQE